MASLFAGNGYRWFAIVLLLLACFGAPSHGFPRNVLSVAVGFYCLWLFASAAFFTPAYSAEAVYRPLILLCSFAAVSAIGRDRQVELFRAGVALLAILVLVGLLQFYAGFWHLDHNPQRAAATFITPNTFATAINLFLLPLVALAFAGRGGRWPLIVAMWLFAGLLATESRGGYLGFAVGCVFIAIYIGVSRSWRAWIPWLRIIAGLGAVLLVFVASLALKPENHGVGTFGSTIISRGSSLRVELASIAATHILERPFTGYGANMFWPFYEMSKPAELDTSASFAFVHNDYLQVWLEFGFTGLTLLCTVILAALGLILRARRGDRTDPLPLACGAAGAGFFTHALVDFPLFVPFLLMVIGAWLGAIAAYAADGRVLGPILMRAGDYLRPARTPLVAKGLAAAAILWLAQPVLADLAERKAVADLNAGHADTALYWQSVARRLEPRNAIRQWTESVIWRDQAIEARNIELAARSDALLEEAISTAPFEIVYYIERARLHRRYPELFEQPASAAKILEWTGRAVELRPYSVPAQLEHARALAHAGKIEEAKRLARTLLQRRPGVDAVSRLAEELKL